MYKIIGGDQKEYEASDAEELRQWVKDGRADGRTLVKAEGTKEWKPLSTLPEFAGLAGATGAVPPPLLGQPTAPDSGASAGQAVSAATDLEIGRCLGRGWELWKENIGLLTSATFLVWLVNLALKPIPFADLFLGGVLYGGLYLVYLRRIRGEACSPLEAFSGFKTGFIQLLLAGFLTTFLAALAGVIFCFLLGLPWLYLEIAWIFSLALVADKHLEFWSAMELSRKTVTRCWGKVLALTLVAFAPFILVKVYVFLKTWLLMSAAISPLLKQSSPDVAKTMEAGRQIAIATAPLDLIAQFVLLINLPFATGALMYAYEDLFGPRPTHDA